MKRYYYDLHIHSCLSPCGSDESTPSNIAGLASLCGFDIVALTDHNTSGNCPAFFAACESFGITPIGGMELTTAEDIHVVCLFETLQKTMAFSDEIQKRRILIKNKKEIFGNQFILDENENIIGEDEFLLPNATTVTLEEAPNLCQSFGGVCFPAHIDRQANGIISVLGTLPETPNFKTVELNQKSKIEEYTSLYNLQNKLIVVDSDAHYLENMREKENYLELPDGLSGDELRSALVRRLQGK